MRLPSLDRGINYQQNNLNFWHQRSCALLGLSWFQEAINNCHLALQYQSENPIIFGHKAFALYELNDYQGAINNFDFSMSYQSDYILLFYTRACMFNKLLNKLLI